MSDQDKISPYNISTISSAQVMKIKKNVNKEIISWSNIKSNITRTNIIRIVWKTLRSIYLLMIFEVKG